MIQCVGTGSAGRNSFLMRICLAIALTALCLALPLQAEEPPAWVRDAVEKLRQEGLLQGYPDGQMNGQKAITRYELVQLLDRIEARDAQQDADFASQSDLEDLKKTATTVRDSLDGLGPDDLESRVYEMELRLNELGRPEL